MKQIRITDNHIYIDEYDISPFVVGGSLKIDGERVSVQLIGDVLDERGAAQAKKQPRGKTKPEEVTDGDG